MAAPGCYPPPTIEELKQRALDFVREVLPEADGFAQSAVAAKIAENVWPTIEAWRSVSKVKLSRLG
jgi:hypothetical protein